MVLVASVWNVENSHSQDEVVLVASVWIVLERHLDVMIVGCTEHTAAVPTTGILSGIQAFSFCGRISRSAFAVLLKFLKSRSREAPGKAASGLAA